MAGLAQKYKDFFADTRRLHSLMWGVAFLLISLIFNHLTVIYAARSISNSSADLLLSNIPVFDVDGLFVYGGLMMVGLISLVGISQPRRLVFLLKAGSLFIIIRAFFVTLTHIAPESIGALPLNNPLHWFTSEGDLFFSGHAGLPFLVALIFWDQRRVRYLLLLLSLFFSVIVLLGHIHYSIDVFAAFFITYSIFALAKVLFARDSGDAFGAAAFKSRPEFQMESGVGHQ